MGLIRKFSMALLTLLAGVIMASGPTSAQQKPNIVIIWGDDIGQSNVSAYSRRDGLQDAQHRPPCE